MVKIMDVRITLLEMINHLLLKHTDLAPQIESLSAQAQGKRPTVFVDKSQIYFSLNDLDRKLEKYLDFNNGYYVELGANDGVTQSNTLHYELYKNWRGILIEPTPHNYIKCREQRGAKNSIFCNACVSFEYKEKFVEILFSNLMSSPLGLETDLLDPKAHAELGRQFLFTSEDIFSFGSLAKPLNSILTDAGAPACIDFLSLDVEGAELEVLKGINYNQFSFKYMLIECRDVEKINTYLSPLNYVLCDQLSEHDYLFKKN
jgi:FkbM family methyltransferase